MGTVRQATRSYAGAVTAFPRRPDVNELEVFGDLETDKLYLAEPDPEWALDFATHERRIRHAIGSTAIAVHHVGSTSVAGLAAKPIIDILLVVPDITAEEDYLAPLVDAGYVLRVREPGHRMLRTPARDVHLHVHQPDAPDTTDLLLFRDRLRSHPRGARALRVDQARTAGAGVDPHAGLRGRQGPGHRGDQGTSPGAVASRTAGFLLRSRFRATPRHTGAIQDRNGYGLNYGAGAREAFPTSLRLGVRRPAPFRVQACGGRARRRRGG